MAISNSSITWNGQYFLFANTSQQALNYSPDGIHWETTNLPANSNTVVLVNNDTLLIGKNRNIYKYSSGDDDDPLSDILRRTTFIPPPIHLPQSQYPIDIASNEDYPHTIVFHSRSLLAYYGNQLLQTSNQGSVWNVSDASAIFSVINDVAWNGDIWVAVGANANSHIFATSIDGISWTPRKNGQFISSSASASLDWNWKQRKYIAAAGEGASIATSSDGLYWLDSSLSTIFSNIHRIRTNGDIWVAVGTPVNPHFAIAYSLDGQTWTTSASPNFAGDATDVYYSNNIWTAFGTDPSYNTATSSDGIYWKMSYSYSPVYPYKLPSSNIYADVSTVYLPSGLIPYEFHLPPIIAPSGEYIQYSHNHQHIPSISIYPQSIAGGEGNVSLASSVDGIYWTAIPNSPFTRCNRIIWTGEKWYAGGIGPAYSLATSVDGKQWTGQMNAASGEIIDIAWNGTYLVAITSAHIYSYSGEWNVVANNNLPLNTFSTIDWTGRVWLAYGVGDGGNVSVAISSAANAMVNWTSISGISSFSPSIVSAGQISNISASSSSSPATNIIDGSNNTYWVSATSQYNTTTGAYIGSTSTTYNTNQTAAGEWIQIQLNAGKILRQYAITLGGESTGGESTSATIRSWILVASNNGSDWTQIDTFAFTTDAVHPPTVSNTYPFSITSIPPSAYIYYRWIATSAFASGGGGDGSISLSELTVLSDDIGSAAGRPILLKDRILHPIQLGESTVCYMSDLYCNPIRDGVYLGEYQKTQISQIHSAVKSANIFDGNTHWVLGASGEIVVMTNSATMSNGEFVGHHNGIPFSNIYGELNCACYNRKYVLIGGTNGIYYAGGLPDSGEFYATNATTNNMFSRVHCIATNPKYGFVHSPNRIYLSPGSQLEFTGINRQNDVVVSCAIYP